MCTSARVWFFLCSGCWSHHRCAAKLSQRSATQSSVARARESAGDAAKQTDDRSGEDREEPDFDVDELAVGVLQKPRDDRVQDVVDVAEEILVDGDLPARHAAPLVTPS